MKSLLDLLPEKLSNELHDNHALGYNHCLAEIKDRLSSLETVRVYGVADGQRLYFQPEDQPQFDKTALLIFVEDVKKGVSKDEIVKAHQEMLKHHADSEALRKFTSLIERMLREGIV